MKTSIILTAALLLNCIFPVRSYCQISEEESAIIISMKDKEKLTYDVYYSLNEKYSSDIFKKMIQNELQHKELSAGLALKYGINISVNSDNEVGKFSNPKDQNIYDEMMRYGGYSLLDAFRAGARMEEINISEQLDYISKSSNEEIIKVFEIIEKGSEEQLRTFVKELQEEGITYKPNKLSQEDYDRIVSVKDESKTKKDKIN